MKTFATFTVMSIFAIIGWCVVTLGFLPNLGLKFGYWGELNRTVAGLRTIPGVQVVNTRINPDITLEEFSVDMNVDGITGISLYFPESSSPRYRLWKEVSYLRLQCNGLNPSGDGRDGYWYWLFDLSPGNILERNAGIEIRSIPDVLDNFRRILALVSAHPPVSHEELSNIKWPPGDNLSLYVPCENVSP